MSTEYTRMELHRRERLIMGGIGIMTNLIERLSEKDTNLSDLFIMADAIRYMELVAEECPTLKTEIGVR